MGKKLNSQSHTKIKTSLNHYKFSTKFKVQNNNNNNNNNIVSPCQLQHIHVCQIIYLILGIFIFTKLNILEIKYFGSQISII